MAGVQPLAVRSLVAVAVTRLDELRARIRDLGHECTVSHDVGGWDHPWRCEVDGQAIARGGDLGELEDGIARWLAAEEDDD